VVMAIPLAKLVVGKGLSPMPGIPFWPLGKQEYISFGVRRFTIPQGSLPLQKTRNSRRFRCAYKYVPNYCKCFCESGRYWVQSGAARCFERVHSTCSNEGRRWRWVHVRSSVSRTP